MAEEKKDPKKEEKPKKTIDVKLLMLLSFVLVNLSVVGLGAYLAYSATIGWKPVSITEEQMKLDKEKLEAEQDAAGAESGPLVYTMDKFTVNLDGQPKRTIRIEVNLEMLGKDGFEEVISNDTRVRARDRIVRLLNGKNFAEIESIQGKLFLKDRIAFEINSILDKGVVKDVYFSEFVVQ
jgi:flagellar FliL protein